MASGFDFDLWQKLASSSPELFEAMRLAIIEKTILESGENSNRLRALQRRIDRERERSRTPFQSYLKSSNLMC